MWICESVDSVEVMLLSTFYEHIVSNPTMPEREKNE